MLRWDAIRHFVAVARDGSVSAAAVSLGVSHATVLRQVKQLEQTLATPLFEHRQSGYRITTEGQELLRYALEMEANAEALLRRAAGQDAAVSGELRVALPDPSLCDPWPLLYAFAAAHPGIRLLPQAAASLPPDVDIALRLTDTPPEELVGRQLLRLPFALQGTEGAVAGPRPRFVLWQDTSADGTTLDWQRQVLAAHSRQPETAFVAPSHGEAVAAVRSGFGVALLTADLPGLLPLPTSAPQPPRGLWLLTHPDLRRAGRIRAFMAFAADHPLEP